MNETNYKKRTWMERCSQLFMFVAALMFSTLMTTRVEATTCVGAITIPAAPTLPYVLGITCGDQ
ncbi:MAG: hypothetical protein IPP34_00850 [Bacteroidetes bacterium]|nr:hypothetical protein [Bacteroidota bacterium]